MTNKLSLALGGFVAIALVMLSLVFLVSGQKDANASFYSGTVIGAATTTTSFAITTSARVLASSTQPTGATYTRVYATICNQNANPVSLLLNNDVAANLSTGKVTAVIAAAAGYDSCYEITDRNLYQGSVTASSTNQTSTVVTVSDYVQ